MAVRVGNKVFHRTTAGGALTADTALTTPVAAVFSGDFSFFVANDGLYKYTAPAYARVVTATFKTNKKIWTSGATRIVILHWVAGKTPPAIDYELKVYSGASYTAAVTVTAVSHTNAPSIAISPSLQTIVLSGKTNAATSVPFYTGKIVDYTAHTSADIVFTNIPQITAT